jgi:hypothetical protein
MKKSGNIYNLPSMVLLLLGISDLVRGFLHTYEVSWAATTFAKLDLSYVRSDQLTLLGAFGISNILTGLIYILISRKAKNISPYILIIIPIAYALGWLGLKVSGISANALFLGKYFILIYLFVCIVTFGVFISNKYSKTH